jgi:hypothetical protein
VAAHRLRRRTKFTLFFVPLIPLGSSYHLVCVACGATTNIDGATLPRVEAEAARQVAAVAQPGLTA